MTIAILVLFIVGYICIVAEHPLRIDKAATALVTGVLCWVLISFSGDIYNCAIATNLPEHFVKIADILLFLLGAMTIVEVVKAHHGFRIVTDQIQSTKKVRLIWIIAVITFFLSAVLDNLTTTIVLVSLCSTLGDDKKTRWYCAGIIVIAANAGGAWSVIGDVTTTMLWTGKQLTALPLFKALLLPSIVNLVVPLIILSFIMKGDVTRPETKTDNTDKPTRFESNTIFIISISGLLFVPIFKNITGLPIFMGMMFSLGIIWIATEILHRRKRIEEQSRYSIQGALRNIDLSSVLFFLGILLAVASLAEVGILKEFSNFLKEEMENVYAINISIGLLSAIIDNVPLVAASMGMYHLEPSLSADAWANMFVQDGVFWHFLAYTAGTGGSILIIGSAAGVAAMGIEKIPFMWYLRHIGIWALLGYFAGAAVYILLQ